MSTDGDPGPVLVATDFSADARLAGERGIAVAGAIGAEVELLHVLSAGWLDALRARAGGPQAVDRLRGEAGQALAEQAAALGGGPGRVRPGVRLLEGAVVETLAALARDAELLVLGAHGQHPFRDAALGSTGERLVRRSSGPVLVVRGASPLRAAPAAGEAPWSRILVGVDFSPFAAAALRWARRVGAGARVETLHAWELPFESRLRTAGVDADEIVRLRAEVRAEALRRLNEFSLDAGFAPGEVQVSVVHGYAPHLIVDHAREFGAGLIVIGKHGESRVEDLLLGSVALHVLAQAPCDVLVVPGAG